MPVTLPPDAQMPLVAPVEPAPHGQANYEKGAHIPAVTDDAPQHGHTTSSLLHGESTTGSRSASPFRSESRGRGAASTGEQRSDSHHRGMSRIRAAIREIVNDPFWHRPSKEEANDPEYQRRLIMNEVHAALDSTEAGDVDRAKSRSRSHARSPLSSQPGSRSGSKVGRLLSHHSSHGAHPDRGAAGFGAATADEKKE
ncbi:hypothetical protein JCM8097_003033 [Rhodosporidiobolus ruineniae]